jgi:hypothetical protein
MNKNQRQNLKVFVFLFFVLSASANPLKPTLGLPYEFGATSHYSTGVFTSMNLSTGDNSTYTAYAAFSAQDQIAVFDFDKAGKYFFYMNGTYTVVPDIPGLCFFSNLTFNDQVEYYTYAREFDTGIFTTSPNNPINDLYTGLVDDVHACGYKISSTIKTPRDSDKMLSWTFSQQFPFPNVGMTVVFGQYKATSLFSSNPPSYLLQLPSECLGFTVDYCSAFFGQGENMEQRSLDEKKYVHPMVPQGRL